MNIGWYILLGAAAAVVLCFLMVVGLAIVTVNSYMKLLDEAGWR